MKANHFWKKSLSNKHTSLPKQPPKVTDTDSSVIDLILHRELILQSTTPKEKEKKKKPFSPIPQVNSDCWTKLFNWDNSYEPSEQSIPGLIKSFGITDSVGIPLHAREGQSCKQ